MPDIRAGRSPNFSGPWMDSWVSGTREYPSTLKSNKLNKPLFVMISPVKAEMSLIKRVILATFNTWECEHLSF